MHILLGQVDMAVIEFKTSSVKSKYDAIATHFFSDVLVIYW